MNTHICLLRGINVSGQKKIKMADLKASFEKLGFIDVVTYIQSGNILFKTNDTDLKTLESTIHTMLLDEYGFDATVIVVTPEKMRWAASNNPFEKDASNDPKKFYVVFLQDLPEKENIEKLATYDYSPEAYILKDTILYHFAANGAGKAKMTNNFFESKLKVKATTRNWRTVHKLVELSN